MQRLALRLSKSTKPSLLPSSRLRVPRSVRLSTDSLPTTSPKRMQSSSAMLNTELPVQQPTKRPRRPILLVSQAEAEEHLKTKTSPWSVGKAECFDALVRKYEFRRYKDAAKFVQDLVEIVQELKHHPVITLTFHEVAVTTYTHEGYTPAEGGEEILGSGISARDFSLAERAESAYLNLLSSLQAK